MIGIRTCIILESGIDSLLFENLKYLKVSFKKLLISLGFLLITALPPARKFNWAKFN